MSYRILIVDDSPAMQRMVQRVVAMSGFEVEDCLFAGNGAEALDLLRRSSIDLILSDINMPEMNGEEFLRALRADQALRAIPVVIVSTDSTLRRIRQMLALGAKGYLSKPFKPEELRLELTRVLGGVHA
jgi:two-component system chemotaxis response regulator CheY